MSYQSQGKLTLLTLPPNAKDIEFLRPQPKLERFSLQEDTTPGTYRPDKTAAPTEKDDELLAVHEALDRLAAHDARKAELVKLRYFAALKIEEAADVLGISTPTAIRDWRYARAWFFREIETDRAHAV